MKLKCSLYKKSIYIVSTPIGNISDITIRALFVLKNTDLILAEDTRITKKLLNYYSIKNKIICFNEFSTLNNINNILKFIIKNNKNISLVSDSGTPLINDPGYSLIKESIKNKISIFSIPGPCAAISGLSISGLSTNKFCYEGFIPKKINDKKIFFKNLCKEKRTIILYETSLRIISSLEEMKIIFGLNKNIVIIKEITKKYENIIRDNIKNILFFLKNNKNFIKGEMMIILEGFDNKNNNIDNEYILNSLKILNKEISINKSIKILSKLLNFKKNIIYSLYLKNKLLFI